MIRNSDARHSGAIRFLCESKPELFHPVNLVLSDGTKILCDCILTACDWAKEHKQEFYKIEGVE